MTNKKFAVLKILYPTKVYAEIYHTQGGESKCVDVKQLTITKSDLSVDDREG